MKIRIKFLRVARVPEARLKTIHFLVAFLISVVFFLFSSEIDIGKNGRIEKNEIIKSLRFVSVFFCAADDVCIIKVHRVSLYASLASSNHFVVDNLYYPRII